MVGFNMKNIDDTQIKFVLLLMPGFSLLSLGGFLDKLRFSSDEEDYGRKLSCTWTLTALSGDAITASCGVNIVPDMAISEINIIANNCDYFVIFGGNHPAKVLSDLDSYRSLLQGVFRRNISLVSVDNAAFLLAASGLISQRIIIHWRHFAEFSEQFRSIIPVTDRNVMEEGKIFSCPGGSATVELAIYLVERKLGRKKAIKGLSDMLVAGFASPSSLTWTQPELENTPAPIKKAIITMRKNVNGALRAEDIAQRSGMSRRQLDRSLVRVTGRTIQQLYLQIKINYACWLMLRTSRTLAQIAADTGFSDASHFSRIFRFHIGLPPARWRKVNVHEMYEEINH